MRTRWLWCLVVPTMLFGLTVLPGLAGQGKEGSKEEVTAIQKKGEMFVAAFDKGDAKALAAMWTADGDYTDQTGRKLVGREAIQKTFESMFAETKGLKLGISSLDLKFLTPDVAIEDGVTEVFPHGGTPPSRARYTVVHVKKGGEWLISSVRDAMFTPPSNYENLRGLEGGIGDWAGETESGEIERISLVWAENQNFITGTFSTTIRHYSLGNAKLWIGWDPIAKNVRSWSFDAAGGFGEGAWSQEGKKWTVKTASTLPDAKKAMATHVITLVDNDTITLWTKDRTVDGKQIPDGKEVKLKRLKNGQP